MTQPSGRSEDKRKGERVLVVEDDYWTRFLLHELLEAHGYFALQAADAAQALRLVHTHHPDLILIDVRLPGPSGVELLRRIRRDDKLRHIPVVAVTAMAMKKDEQMLRAGGCADYLSKPFSSAALIATVRRCLTGPEPEAAQQGKHQAEAPAPAGKDRPNS